MKDKAIAICAVIILALTACNGIQVSNLPAYPPKYIQPAVNENEKFSKNTLWKGSTKGLFGDVKARNVNDLVTIKVVESSSASKNAETGTSRDSSLEASVDTFFGLPLDLGIQDFTPQVGASVGDSYEGKGKTSRSGSLVATITGKVVEVLPNGNLIIESRKEITVNNEEQILILRGLIRPEDVASDNTISSDYIAEAQIFYTGDGVLADKQAQGWFVRVMDKVWPF